MSPTAPEANQPEALGRELPQTANCTAGLDGCTGRGELRLDPYDYDVNNRKVYRYLCDHCDQEYANDI